VDRPPIRCFAAGHVVQAVSVKILPASVKDVWHIVHRFDRRPTGCELPASVLADKIGLEHQTVRAHIVTLGRLGLLVRLPGAGLCATLPDDCVPSSNRPGWEEVGRLARRLEGHIYSTCRSGSTVPVDADLQPHVDEDLQDFGRDRGENGRSAPTADTPKPRPSGVVGAGGELLQLESAHAPDDQIGVPDMYLTLDEQEARRERQRRRTKA
jgi:hypothetical protein